MQARPRCAAALRADHSPPAKHFFIPRANNNCSCLANPKASGSAASRRGLASTASQAAPLALPKKIQAAAADGKVGVVQTWLRDVHRRNSPGFKERRVVLSVAHPWASASSYLSSQFAW